MIETGIKMCAAQRDLEMEHLAAAEEAVKHAVGDEELAKSLETQAHNDAIVAEKHAGMLESMDDDYDNVERVRDMSVAHAAHHVEDDAKAMFDAAKKEEIRARDYEAEATRILEQLEHNEAEMKDTLKQLQAQKMEKDVEGWKKRKDK